MNKISVELARFDIPKNRTGNLATSNELNLPITLDNCLINVDENYQATSNSINRSLSALYTNFLHVYSRCFLLNNNFPTNSPTYIGIQQVDTPSILTIDDINSTSTTTLLNTVSAVNFTVNRFIESYSVSITLSTAATPPLTAAKDLAYTYVDAFTSLPNNLFAGNTPVENSGTYTVSLTGLPSVFLNNDYNTNPSSIFLTTSLFTTNSGELNLVESTTNDLFTKFSFYSNLSAGIDDLVDVQVGYNSYTNTKVLICASKTNLFIFTDVNGNFDLVYSSNTVGYKRDIVFVNITSILIDGTTLYVADSYHNSIYKLDASGFLSNNHINSDRLIVENIIGGTGTGSDTTQFSIPVLQFIFGGKIFVFDKDNKFIKIYDLNLNFINSINLSNLFKRFPFTPTIRPFTKNIHNGELQIYLLSTYTLITKQLPYTINSIVILNPNTFTPYKAVNITFNNTLENIRYCLQSANEENISYVMTNIGLYKFNTTNFSQIGYFGQVINNCKYICLVEEDGKDVVYVYSTPGYGIFTKYVEESTYTTLLTNDDFNVYSLDELYINENENQTFFVYNKTFKKLFQNFYKLLTNIAFRPSYSLVIGTSLNSHIFNGLKYLDNATSQNLILTESKDFYIGENEIFCNSVINRVITKFYITLQQANAAASNSIVTNFNTITLPSNNVINGSFIMTEQYNPTDTQTYQSIILTEDGRGIVVESAQGVSSVPSTTTDTVIVDSNVTVTTVTQTTSTVLDLNVAVGSINNNIGIVQ